MATVMRPTEHVAVSVHEAGVVFLHTRTGQLFTSNSVGARIWQQLEARAPVDDIVTDLSARYGIPPETARTATLQFVTELERQQLLQATRS